MCTVSLIAQDFGDRWRDRLQQPYLPQQEPFDMNKYVEFMKQHSPVSRAEFDARKKDLEAVKKLLAAAKVYDAETGQPDCEDAAKTKLFRDLAKVLNVDLADIFPTAE